MNKKKILVIDNNTTIITLLEGFLTEQGHQVKSAESAFIALDLLKTYTPDIVIKIDDNGCGMTEQDQNNLFKPFITSKTQGTGLGLVIVQKMLASMDGTISINSIRDFGTTVTLSLPEVELWFRR